MTKNVTIRIDEELLRAAKHQAVEHDQSLSQWVAGLLAREVTRQDSLEQARQRALKRLEKGVHLGGKPLTREQMHER
ncbi:MAG: DUF6364 family protein [Planctomycetota bacterium]